MKSLQLFQPSLDTLYTLDATARLTGMSRHAIIVCTKHGLIYSYLDKMGAYYFDDKAIRVLRNIQHLHVVYGFNLSGIKMVLDLLKEVESLQVEIQFLRRPKVNATKDIAVGPESG